MSRPTPTQKPAVSRNTVKRYRQQGLDVGPKGKPDREKVQAIHEEKIESMPQEKGPGHKYWDERYRKAKALTAEKEYLESVGELLKKSEVYADTVRRETAIKKGIVALSRSLPPLLAGQSADSMRQIIYAQVAKIFNRLAKTL